MDYFKLQQNIKNNEIPPILLFQGEEEFLKEEALKYLQANLMQEAAGAIEREVLKEEYSLEVIIEKANTLPLFAARKLIIIENPTFLMSKKSEMKTDKKKNKDDIFLTYLENPNPLANIVFVVKGKADSRKKVSQQLAAKGWVVDFSVLRYNDLFNWCKERFLERDKKVNQEIVNILIQHIGNDLNFLLLEIDKLCTYTADQQEISKEDLEKILSKTLQSSIFNLVDAVAEKKGVLALRLTRDLLKMGEKEIKIIFMLARQFRMIFKGKIFLERGYTSGQIPQLLQVPPFVAKKIVQQGGNFTKEQLLEILEKLLKIDLGIKTGIGNPNILLESTITELCIE